MPLYAIGLLITAALLHALWNLLLKQSPEKYIASWWTVVIGGILFSPFLFITGLPPQHVWGILLASAFVEGLYFTALSFAYQSNDFSLVYPIARGSAPIFLSLWSLFILKEEISRGGLFGMGLIVLGLLIIGWSSLRQQTGGPRPNLRGVLSALLVALCISIYTALDGFAVKQAAPIPYALSLFTLIPIVVTPPTLIKYGWPSLKKAGLLNWKKFAGISILGILAYGLTLLAYSIAPVGYGGAIREMSVVFGALAGWKFLNEPLGSWRLAGALFIFSGIFLIAIIG